MRDSRNFLANLKELLFKKQIKTFIESDISNLHCSHNWSIFQSLWNILIVLRLRFPWKCLLIARALFFMDATTNSKGSFHLACGCSAFATAHPFGLVLILTVTFLILSTSNIKISEKDYPNSNINIKKRTVKTKTWQEHKSDIY